MYVALPGVAVPIDQRLCLGPDLGEQLRHDLGVERDEIVDTNALDRTEDAIAHPVGGVVAGAGEPERDRADRVLAELAGRHQAGAPRGDAQHERARPTDEGAVEIEERRARPADTYGDDRAVAWHSADSVLGRSDIAIHRQCEVVDASLRDLQLADHRGDGILAAVALECHVQRGSDLVVADLAAGQARPPTRSHTRRAAPSCRGASPRRRACRATPTRTSSSARGRQRHRRCAAARLGEVLDGALDAMRCLVHHGRARLGGDGDSRVGALAARTAAGSPRTRSGWCRIR